MKKIYFFLLVTFAAFSTGLQAQVSNYTFSQIAGTFTPITGGTLIGTATSDDQYFVDPAVPAGGTATTGPGFPIGFNFTYNGFVFDRIAVNNNGWISLGQSTLTPSVSLATTSAYTPLASTATNTPAHLRSRIAGVGRDIQAQAGASLRIETIGTAPNRTLVVQWLNYKKFGTGGTGDNLNFQIRLNETTNTIDVVYGTMVFNATANTADVGLGGSTAADFNNRTTTTNWNTSTAGTANTNRMAMQNTVTPPVSGTTFRWTPPTPCSGAPTPGNTISSANPACNGVSFNLSLQNNPPVSGLTYQWQSSTTGAAGSYTNIAGATGPTYTATQSAATFYQAIVTCAGSSTASAPIQITMAAPTSCYCIPGTTSCTASDVITNVTVSTLNNNSTCSTNGYADYTTSVASTNLISGATLPMSVTVGPGGTEHVAIWIDYNQNGIFEATEFQALGSGNGVTINGNITIPSSAMTGATRMRVRVRFSTPLTGADACIGYTFGETEDYAVNIVPCVQGTITTQPVDRSIACGGNTTFSVAATGSLLTYEWQYRTSATGPWLLVPNAAPYSGVTTNTLTITNASAVQNNYQYRAVLRGACTAPINTNAAVLTITSLVPTLNTTLPVLMCSTDAPKQISITNPAGVTSTTTVASAPALNIAIPDNGTVTGISNTINVATIPAGVSLTGLAVKVNIAHNWVGDLILVLKGPNGQIINLAAALTATGGAGPTTGFTNTVISSTGTTALSAGANPYTATFRADLRTTPMNLGAPYTNVLPGPTGFQPTSALWSSLFSQANGDWTLALYDYYQDDLAGNRLVNWSLDLTYGAIATGVFSPNAGLFTDAAGTIPYTGTAVTTVYAKPATSTTYSVVVTTPNCTSSALSIPVTVSTQLTGVTAPATANACINGATTLTVAAATGNLQNVQWQVSTDGGATYTNIANGGIYSNATTPNLTITGAPSSASGNLYRAIVSNSCNSVTTTATTFTVNPNPVVTLTASPTELLPGMTTTLTATVTPNAAATYTWFRNGLVVPGATGNTLVVDVDALGEYTVQVNDINSCTSTSNAVTITDAASDVLFIYPSPNTGQFQVRYRAEQGNINLPRVLNVFDSKGAKVYSRTYRINTPYERLDVDLRNHGKGIYMVELADRNGQRIKAGRVLVL